MLICEKCRCQFKSSRNNNGLSSHSLYGVWFGIKERCYNTENRDYHNYGGRGIKMSDEWKSDFKSFYDWALTNGWQKGLHTDRIDNDGDYSPFNCRFVTNRENQKTKRRRQGHRQYEYRGVLYSLVDLSRLVGVKGNVLWNRIVINHWEIEEAVLTPVKKIKQRDTA